MPSGFFTDGISFRNWLELSKFEQEIKMRNRVLIVILALVAIFP